MIEILNLMIGVALTITSPAFRGNGMIPSKYTCEGENSSPALHIEALPTGTRSLAIILHDPDAPIEGGFTHWVVWNIDPIQDIPENFKGGTQGFNSADKSGYRGPCPPSGTHHYHFRIYALDTKLELPKNAHKDQLEKAMQGHILSEGDLVGLYKKTK
jgi:Raf kinase inhibitor-like YbhB/YbcL family protein